MRAAYTLATLLAVVGLWVLMLKGWRSRQRRQADLPAPAAAPSPRGDLLADPAPGLFVGTVVAGSWLDRIAVHGLGHRAAGTLLVTGAGVHVERAGLPELFVPLGDLVAVAVGQGLAGRVVGPQGMLLLDWRLGDRTLTSGFRADDHGRHEELALVLGAYVTPQEASS